MPEGSYGWIQQCGNAYVLVSGEAQPAFADFRPNEARLQLGGSWPKAKQEHPQELPADTTEEDTIAHQELLRLSQLPPLLIEAGPYCSLIREARDVFVDGHFYACVAMCGISLERFQRDKAEPYGATRKHKMPRVRRILQENNVLKTETLALCKKMAKLRNDYAHGEGLKPKEDALKALQWMHSFLDNETNLMRDYVITDGVLSRKHTAGKN